MNSLRTQQSLICGQKGLRPIVGRKACAQWSAEKAEALCSFGCKSVPGVPADKSAKLSSAPGSQFVSHLRARVLSLEPEPGWWAGKLGANQAGAPQTPLSEGFAGEAMVEALPAPVGVAPPGSLRHLLG